LKSLITLWNILAKEFASRCCTSATMDIKTVQGRSDNEGFSFFTITLPDFGRDFQKSLDLGLVDHALFCSFSRRGGLPQFLGGFLDLVFDRRTGVLLDEPSIEAILAIRQLTLLYSKILLPCSNTRVKKAMDDYVECESQVNEVDSRLFPGDYSEISRMSSLLYRTVFSGVDSDIYSENIVPKHGPGATADKIRGNGKFTCRTWTDRLEKVFPAGDYLFPSVLHYSNEYEDVSWLEPDAEIPVKVISVPKTQKTPRIIAVEPTCQQYCQQAMLEAIIQRIANSDISNFLGFEDQIPNQSLALAGSRNGELATLDLSEASDRVSFQHVRALLARHPLLLEAVDACRSRKADVPGHGVLSLAKFASMGSALTFPFEAMLFLSLVFLGIEKELNTQFTDRAHILSFIGKVRIYGDDIIVPTDMVISVIDTLEYFGIRVGSDKSFWTGRFRESCGKEYYDGHDVSIVKVRHTLPTSRRHVQEIISTVSLRNQLYMAGCWQTVKWLDSRIRDVIHYFPDVLESSPVLGRTTSLGYIPEKMCDVLHRPLVKGYVVHSRLPSDVLDGSGALLKFFLKRGGLPTADERHLERAGRPRTVDIKTRWATPY
jgi:hypothetical protein